MSSISPNTINRSSVLFRIVAGDLEWMLAERGYSMDDMDPHSWARVKAAVQSAMAGVWADVCADVVRELERKK